MITAEVMDQTDNSVIKEEYVDLVRGGSVTTNILGAFGQSVKETRLTAWLGYILAVNPNPLLSLFGFEGNVLSIRLETRHTDGRSDILIETSKGIGVIEAKIDASDASHQSRRYPGRWRAVLTLSPGRLRDGVLYVHWQKLANRLDLIAKHATPEYKFLVVQFNAYLKEHHMIKNTESLEIYAREINEPITLRLFIHGHMYGCDYDKNNKVIRAQYFAPHFGERIARRQPGIMQGVSYVAQIKDVIYAETWSEFKSEVCKKRGKTWWNNHSEIMDSLHRQREWLWGQPNPRTFLLLGEPRLAFNPPVKKEKLQSGKGFLSRRFFAFDDFFAVWGQ
jgi:hypothetical protein